MFSIADMAVAGAVALLLFGPDQLPKVARRAGQLVRDVQNTSQSFIREMERAADSHDEDASGRPAPAAASSSGTFPAAPAYHETPEPASQELVAREAALAPSPSAGAGAIDPHTAVDVAAVDPHTAPDVAGVDPRTTPGVAGVDPHTAADIARS